MTANYLGGLPYFDSSNNSARYFPQIAGIECVPCPRVCSVMGSKMNLPRFTYLISRSAMPNSGGLISSSAELMAITGA
jgi:shikimate kinase